MLQIVARVWTLVIIIQAALCVHGKAETLVITAYLLLDELYIDGEMVQTLPNGDDPNIPDYVTMEDNTRLIALKAYNHVGIQSCGGVLASAAAKSIATDSGFKCVTDSYTDWFQPGFDESAWAKAVEYGDNTVGRIQCSQNETIADIDPNAKWIWTDNLQNVGLVVFCRGYTTFCNTSSPCLNGGTCLNNSPQICMCTPQFTGKYCETAFCNTSSPCLNGGTCLHNDQAWCLCLPQFTGDYCETEIPTTFEDTTVEITTETTQAIELSTESTQDTSQATKETTQSMTTSETIGDTSETTQESTSTQSMTTSETIGDTSETTQESTSTQSMTTSETIGDTPETTQESTSTQSMTTSETIGDTSETTHESTSTQSMTTSETIGDTSETTQESASTQSMTTSETIGDTSETTQESTSTQSMTTSETIGDTSETTQESASTQSMTTSETIGDTSETTQESTSTQSMTTSETIGDISETTPETTRATVSDSTPNGLTDPSNMSSSDFVSLATITWTRETMTTDDDICDEDQFCNGPMQVSGSDIRNCQCPSGYLNINNNCCVNQWWIIGLTLICAGIVIGVVISVIACLGCPCKKTKGAVMITDAPEAGVVHSDGAPSANVAGKAPGTGVPATATMLHEVTAANSNGHGVDPAHAVIASSATTQVSSQQPLQSQPAPKKPHEVITTDDLLYNPLMVDLVASDSYTSFQPSLDAVPTEEDFAIQRPTIELEEQGFHRDNYGFVGPESLT